VKDRFGVCWQIVPAVLGKLLHSDNAQKSANVMKAMMKMVKLDIHRLQRAHDEAA
jgi:predicted 3-demethylubiquinone-9 3-methyltransferase (glyoxalase superfamily)